MSAIKPDTAGAISFLRTVYPEGPWALTAINPDRKGLETQTFYPTPESFKLLERWLHHHNGRSNLYWHVNPVTQAIQKKAQREDIKEVCFLHVDIDPVEGRELAAEQQRILGMLQAVNSLPPPTFIIYSGGGYQAFWKLIDPIPINGDLARAEEAKRYNLQIETLFGADNCHNVDRIMRLPGSVNLPDAKKKKKGRVAALAHLVEFKQEHEYPLSRFTAAPLVQLAGEKGFSSGGESKVQLSGNIRRLTSVDDLNEYNVPDRVKVIIVQGCLPDEPKQGDNSRSAWVFDCACNLVRARVPDEVIFSILTEKDFGISASILDMGANAEKYAIRQIERAKEEAVDPWLRKLNERYAVIGNVGGKCRIVEEVNDPALGRTRLTRQSFEDFCNRYMNQFVIVGKDKEGKDMTIPVGKWWLKNSDRKQYDTIVFSPGHETPGCYNLWKGFSCAAKPGDCRLFLEHIKTNICGGNDEYYTYLISWMARTVQRPDSPGQTAIVLRGKQGTGKSFFVKTFGGLFGRHFLAVSDPKHLVGSFNAHLRDTVVLFGDEAFYAGDKKHESVLKMLITEEVIAVESKGIDVEPAPNYLHVLLASNSQWVVPAGAEERRYFVLDVGDASQQDTLYFKKIQAQLKAGGNEALLHFLLNFPLGEFEVRKVPKTKALHEQKLLSLSPEEEWWYRKLEEARMLDEHDGWVRTVLKHEVVNDYLDYMKSLGSNRRSNETVLGKFLHRMCPGLKTFQARATFHLPVGNQGFTKEVKRRAYHFEFPTLKSCRSRWVELYGGDGFATEEEQEVLKIADPIDISEVM